MPRGLNPQNRPTARHVDSYFKRLLRSTELRIAGPAIANLKPHDLRMPHGPCLAPPEKGFLRIFGAAELAETPGFEFEMQRIGSIA